MKATASTLINIAISVTALILCSGRCATTHALPAITAAHAVLGLTEETDGPERLREAMTDRDPHTAGFGKFCICPLAPGNCPYPGVGRDNC